MAVHHILNGDALSEQFPSSIKGQKHIMRECLVDGPVNGSTLNELYETRSAFLSENYQSLEKPDYCAKVVSELNAIQAIKHGAEINLWFEDDLFCQVNFWFVVSLLGQTSKDYSLFLVRPDNALENGFGGLTMLELRSAFENRLEIVRRDELSRLWLAYQHQNTTELLTIAKTFENEMPFVLEAAMAHIGRLPSENSQGIVIESLKEILEKTNRDNFQEIFTAFKKALPIYGFGDLQVQRLLKEIDELPSNN